MLLYPDAMNTNKDSSCPTFKKYTKHGYMTFQFKDMEIHFFFFNLKSNA